MLKNVLLMFRYSPTSTVFFPLFVSWFYTTATNKICICSLHFILNHASDKAIMHANESIV